MLTGKVDDIAWSRLRPRREVPQSIKDSIPPQDVLFFVRLLAMNPHLPSPESEIVRDRIRCFKQWSTLDRNEGDFIFSDPSSFRILERAAKRPYYVSTPTGTPSYDESFDSASALDSQPRRKQRRSSRPSLAGTGVTSAPSANEESSIPVHIGDDYQASVPPKSMLKSRWSSEPPLVLSKLVFSPAVCQGQETVSAFLQAVNEKMRRRDGFELTPFALEIALRSLAMFKGNTEEAAKHLMRNLPRGSILPGIKSPFTYEEQCKIVGTLAERGKKFEHISRHVLPERSTSELVWMYYAQHKQSWLQNGGLKNGQLLDDGGESLKKVSLTTERVVGALRSLGITAGDGYPMDSRAQQAVFQCRRGRVAEERRRREQENILRGTRTRNGH